MGRLIDGDKLIEDLRRYRHENISVDGLEGIIALIPSANPERKTGKWIRHPIYEGSDHYYYACSECDYRSWTHDNYCSVCGARMEAQDD